MNLVAFMVDDAGGRLWVANFSTQSNKTFTTNDSRVVPHRSTELAQWCLVSQIGRDATISPRYERMMIVHFDNVPIMPKFGNSLQKAPRRGIEPRASA